MREFLFRGKTVPTEDCESEWIEGDLLSNAYPIPNIRPLGSGCCYRVIPESVGQFTGLYDSTKWEALSELEQQEWFKNYTFDEWKGRKIFEGDIIKATYNNKTLNTFYVYFEEGVYWCKLISGYFICGCETLSEQSCECRLEVIGNICDNPELLQN